MTKERLEEIESGGGWVDLSARAKWRLSGGDRVRYLNGQVTQDVRKASAKGAVYACVTDVKGRICGDVCIQTSDDGETLLVDAEPELAESLGMRLERYIIADDVELTEVTDDWSLWHVFGKAAEGVDGVTNPRVGESGIDLWLPRGKRPERAERELSPEEWETLRVLRGVPRYPKELNGDIFPPEARLEERAMDFAKGCYIGQEILSRIRTTGKMPKKLVRWTAVETTAEIAEAAPIQTMDGGTVGAVTSRAMDPRSGLQVGLGFVKQGVATDSELLVGGVVASIADSSQYP